MIKNYPYEHPLDQRHLSKLFTTGQESVSTLDIYPAAHFEIVTCVKTIETIEKGWNVAFSRWSSLNACLRLHTDVSENLFRLCAPMSIVLLHRRWYRRYLLQSRLCLGWLILKI